MPEAAITAEKVEMVFPPGTKALNGIDLTIFEREWTTIMGPSGSGKTTLLNLISCLDRPTSGRIEVLGSDLSKMKNKELTVFRRNNLGMVYQQYHLIPYLTALENVEIAQHFHSMVDRPSAESMLKELGLGDRMGHVPGKLSGGEQQRVSIARALINDPRIVLADEPTGNLDRANGKKIMEILRKLRDKGQTIVFVTHDPELASWGDRVINLCDGKVVKEVCTI